MNPTTKKPPRPETADPSAGTAPPPPELTPEELAAVLEAHTLAQMIYGRIAATRPWLLSAPTPGSATPAPAMSDPRRSFVSPPIGGAPYFHQFR